MRRASADAFALPPTLLVLVAAGALAGTVGAYWDLAWHTDVGRDAFFSPPHLLLYAGVAVLMTGISIWALALRRATGSWRCVVGLPQLVLPAVGGALALAAAPVDEFWHHAFGRDSVVWSPPHMVAIVGLIACGAGVLHAVGMRDGRGSTWARSVAGAFLLIALMFVVVEYETDVPQFSLVWYLPLVAAGAAFGFRLIARVGPGAWTATQAAGAFTIVRAIANGFLVALDHSTAIIPPLLAVAVIADMARQREASRAATTALLTGAVMIAYPTTHLVSRDGLWFTTGDLLIALPLTLLTTWTALAATGRRRLRLHPKLAMAALVAVVALVGTAWAHDPGQGDGVATVSLQAEVQAMRIDLDVIVLDDGRCDALRPLGVLARRAGREVRTELKRVGACRFIGRLDVPANQRWFVYAEFADDVGTIEAWLPAGGGDLAGTARVTELYRALQPRSGIDPLQVVAGTLLYLLNAVVLAVVVRHLAGTPAVVPRDAVGVT